MNWILEKPMLDDDPELESAHKVLSEISKFVIGKRNVLEHVLMALFSNGHVLFEDYPGLAKTLIARSLAQATGCLFRRVQFTPDLLPADIIGTYVLNRTNYKFELRKGPIFTNILLADEINRAPPRTQSALLEAMQERQVTIENETLRLADPFIVLATQNPIEYEGTYPLPEAQLDRFIMRLNVGYPSPEEEVRILENRILQRSDNYEIKSLINADSVLKIQLQVESVHVEKSILKYITDIVRATRDHPDIEVGSSPRGSLALLKLSRARAWLSGRAYVIPDDVKDVAIPALSHRLILRPEVWMKGEKYADMIVRDVIGRIPVPKVD
jgi:MoxR-like ATPase